MKNRSKRPRLAALPAKLHAKLQSALPAKLHSELHSELRSKLHAMLPATLRSKLHATLLCVALSAALLVSACGGGNGGGSGNAGGAPDAVAEGTSRQEAATDTATVTATVTDTATATAAPGQEDAAQGAPEPGAAAPLGGQLNLFTWEGMFPQDILDGFEAETGVRVNYVNFDLDETMLSRLQAAGGGDYDLVIADDYIIETVIQEGLAQPLDKAALQNYGNINPIYQRQFYDPTDAYTVPYGAGVQTIVYDQARTGFEISGYADLWNPALKDDLGVIANYRVIDGMALKVLGESYNTDDTGTISAAGDKLIELAPNIRLIKDDQLEADLLSGEISAAVMYTSQVFMAVQEQPDLKVVFPSEGIGFGIMASFVPSKAPNPAAAHAFLDYVLDAQRGADCFEYLGYYSTNAAADAYIAPELKELLTLPEGFSVDMEMIQNISPEAEERHSLVWTAFMEASGQ
jgi:spermidine/putrescine-binding protein